MKRSLVLTAAALALLAFAMPARQAQASMSIGVSFGSGRHGGLSLAFQSRPDLALIPSSRVYYARGVDQDLYCYDNDWFYVDQGNWYTSQSYRGPFVSIGFTSVPNDVRNIPGSYRRHWGSDDSGYAAQAGYSGYTGQAYGSTRNRDAYTQRQSWGGQRQGQTQSWSDRNQDQNQRLTQNQSWGGRNQTQTQNQTQNQGPNRGHGNNRSQGRGNQGNGRWNRNGT